MPKFKVEDVFKHDDIEYVVLELYFHGYVVRRVDSTHGIDRTFLYDDEPEMHKVETKPVNLGLEALAARKKRSKHH